jgi:hypothetical protein
MDLAIAGKNAAGCDADRTMAASSGEFRPTPDAP